ncbi:20024_t:CDS:2 [Entrophospora sp. SA101]|nr:20024_t:CDS:2 [Entrophospora sp. SA101]
MTNDNFKPITGFKKAPFIPKTETRIFLGGRPIEPANHTERQSFSGQNKQHYQSERANEINPGYGPCRYLGCPYSTDFDIRISIEGNTRQSTHLLVNDDLYVVNLVGLHCAEDNKFCNCALSIIRKAVNYHERGGEVGVNETIDSNVSK